MIRESKTSPAVDAPSGDTGPDRQPAELHEPAQACCVACGALLHCSARFCSECGAAQAAPAEDETAEIDSQFGSSSADVAELLSAKGHVVPCPRCDELNNASAAYCRHCGQQLAVADALQQATPAEEASGTREVHDEPPQGPVPPTVRRRALPIRRYGLVIVLMALLGIEVALWLKRPPMAPASLAAHDAASRSVPTAQPAEPVASTAPVEPVAPLPVAPSPAPEASGKPQAKSSSAVPLSGGAQERVSASEGAHKKVAKTAVLAASASIAIDEIYRQRAAVRCAAGLPGLICRERLRLELCKGKWTQDAESGMEICRLNR